MIRITSCKSTFNAMRLKTNAMKEFVFIPVQNNNNNKKKVLMLKIQLGYFLLKSRLTISNFYYHLGHFIMNYFSFSRLLKSLHLP